MAHFLLLARLPPLTRKHVRKRLIRPLFHLLFHVRSKSARTPNSRATWLIGLPLSCTSRTASTLYSLVNVRLSAMMDFLLPVTLCGLKFLSIKAVLPQLDTGGELRRR